MFKATKLFKAPALMVIRLNDKTVVHIVNDVCDIKINEDAINLFLDYLRVCKAYFMYCGYSRKELQEFYNSVAQKLHPHNDNEITRLKVTNIIQELGCITDWTHLHQQKT
jgi:hypothetical protein